MPPSVKLQLFSASGDYSQGGGIRKRGGGRLLDCPVMSFLLAVISCGREDGGKEKEDCE